MLIQARTTHEPSLRYLRELVAAQGDGGAPNVSPVNTFEASWSLNLLRAAGAITKDHPEVGPMRASVHGILHLCHLCHLWFALPAAGRTPT